MDKHDYYIKASMKGEHVVLHLDAQQQEFVVEQRGKEVKRMPIKGLKQSGTIPFDRFVEQLREEAG